MDDSMQVVQGLMQQLKSNQSRMLRALQKKLNSGKPLGLPLEEMIAEHVSLVEEMNQAIAPEYAAIRSRGISGSLTKEILRRSSFPFETISALGLSFYGRWKDAGSPSISLTAKDGKALLGRSSWPSRFATDVLGGHKAVRIGLDGEGWLELGLRFSSSDRPIRMIHVMHSYMRVAGSDGVSIPLGGLSSAEGIREYADELSFVMPLLVEAYESKAVQLQPSIALWCYDGYGRAEFEMIPVVGDQTIAEMLSAKELAAPVDVPNAVATPLSEGFLAAKRLLLPLLAVEPKRAPGSRAKDHVSSWFDAARED